VLFSPGVVVQLVRLEGGAPHHSGGCGGVQPGPDALPEGVERFARQPQLAGEAGRGLPLGNATQQQHQGRRRLTGLCEDGPGQPRVIASAHPTPVSRKAALYTEEPAIWAPAVWALQAPGVKVAFQPEATPVVVQQVGYREVDHPVILPHAARWLHMSRAFYHLPRRGRN
jgi:hypothetical protein